MKVFLVVYIILISKVWGNNYLIETKEKETAPEHHYESEAEAGYDYSQDEYEPIKAETLICQHLKKSAFEEFNKLKKEEKIKIVEDMNQIIVNSRKQKDSKQGDDGDYYLNNNNKLFKNIKDITRGTQNLLTGITALLKIIDLPEPPPKIPSRRKFCFMEFKKSKKTKKSKKCNKSKKCKQSKKSKYSKKPKG